jgi:hypothetical protein
MTRNESDARLGVPRLGIGPMSKGVVDAAIRLARRRHRRVMLVASRSQIECEELGRGYVEGWSTESFVEYVRGRDPEGYVELCRDHGGPWQHPGDVTYPGESAALRRSLVSFRADIAAGLTILHIDTSREDGREADFESALRRLVQLYSECSEYASSLDRTVIFEVGLEKQRSEVGDPAEFSERLHGILSALKGDGLPQPAFVVAQTGTRVVADGNVGLILEKPREILDSVAVMARICAESGVLLKAHNTDYLPGRLLADLRRRGVDAVNVAPEFGVVETRTLLNMLKELGLRRERDTFLQVAHDSRAWEKWFETEADDYRRAVVAGHYVFSDDRVVELREVATAVASSRGVSLSERIAASLDLAMHRYADVFLRPAEGAS